jgi:hypothetical protein
MMRRRFGVLVIGLVLVLVRAAPAFASGGVIWGT